MTSLEVASVYKFRLDCTWQQLSAVHKARVEKAMIELGRRSVNGAPGFHTTLRNEYLRPQKKPPQLYRPTIRHDGFSVADEAPDPITLSDLTDIL